MGDLGAAPEESPVTKKHLKVSMAMRVPQNGWSFQEKPLNMLINMGVSSSSWSYPNNSIVDKGKSHENGG